MSSMHRAATLPLLLLMTLAADSALGQDGSEWDRARAQLASSQSGVMAQAIARWQQLSASNGTYSFGDYANFLISYPGFPDEAKLRGYAEKALAREPADGGRLLAYFDRVRPLTNPAKAQY